MDAATIADVINEFLNIESMCDEIKQRSYKARKKLEQLSAPAPSGGAKVLSLEQERELVNSRNKRVLRK